MVRMSLTKKKAIKILNELFSLSKLTGDLGSDMKIVDDFFKERGFQGFEDFWKQTNTFGFRDPKYREIDSRAWSSLVHNYNKKFRVEDDER